MKKRVMTLVLLLCLVVTLLPVNALAAKPVTEGLRYSTGTVRMDSYQDTANQEPAQDNSQTRKIVQIVVEVLVVAGVCVGAYFLVRKKK